MTSLQAASLTGRPTTGRAPLYTAEERRRFREAEERRAGQDSARTTQGPTGAAFPPPAAGR